MIAWRSRCAKTALFFKTGNGGGYGAEGYPTETSKTGIAGCDGLGYPQSDWPMIGLDTNVLVRYFTQDDAKQAVLAERCINDRCTADQPCRIDPVVLCELVWVLESAYVDRKAARLPTFTALR